MQLKVRINVYDFHFALKFNLIDLEFAGKPSKFLYKITGTGCTSVNSIFTGLPPTAPVDVCCAKQTCRIMTTLMATLIKPLHCLIRM